jgi:hypothetical protein
MRLRRRWPAIALALLWPVSLLAQDAARLAPVDIVGTRVRVRSAAPRGTLTGLLVASDDQSVTLRLKSGTAVNLARESILGLEQSQGRETPGAVRVAWIALGVGLGAAIAAEHVDSKDCGVWSGNACSRSEAILGGVLVGGLFLSLAKPPSLERWREVTIPQARSGVTITRHGDGVGVGLGVRF